MTAPAAPPVALHSIAFAYPGNRGTIPLRDPVTSQFLGDHPEWTAGGRQVPAAFVRGSVTGARVCFARIPGGGQAPAGAVRIGARAEGAPGVAEREIVLAFDQAGISAPIDFQLNAPHHLSVRTVQVEWHWYLRDGAGEHPIGISRHEWLLAWRQPIPPTDWASLLEPRDGPVGQPDVPWVYLPIMRWTCEWGTEQGDERQLCDALLAGLPKSGLVYAVGAWNVRDMLLKGGGYCGAFYRMFQALAGAQGVHLERRQFAVDWRPQPGNQARWCAIVVETPGLNRKAPAEDPSTFHDVGNRPVERSPVDEQLQRRYRFWGIPNAVGDGHSLNFLHAGDRWYLYDASFQHRVELDGFELPPSDHTKRISVETLGNFKEAYLDVAVQFMLGSLQHGGRLFETVHPVPGTPNFKPGEVRNGLSVKTALVEDRDAAITFYWV